MKIKIPILIFCFVVILSFGVALMGNTINKERDNNNHLQQEIEQQEKTYSGKIDALTTYQEGLVLKISNLEANCSNLTSSYNNLQNTYQAYVSENELKIENLKTELASVKQSLADLQASSEVDKAKITELQNKITNLEKSISEKTVTIEQLNSTIETQKATIAELQNTVNDLTAELNSDLRTQVNFYKSIVEGTTTTITASDLIGVTTIRPFAFAGFSDLIVELPSTCKSIGSFAFISYPSGSDLFSCSSAVLSITFNEGLETISAYAFGYDFPVSLSQLPSTIIYLGSGLNLTIDCDVLPSSLIYVADNGYYEYRRILLFA